MLDPRKYNTEASFVSFQSMQSLRDQPFPRSPEGFWEMERQAFEIATGLADQVMSTKIIEAHRDEVFVREAVKAVKTSSTVRLLNKGWQVTSVLLLGGTRLVLKTPYLREDHKGKSGRKRRKRGPQGTGRYPVLEALGIAHKVSPATRSEMSLYLVQAGGYQEAVEMLRRRALSCDISTLVRVVDATAQTSTSLRDAALAAALEQPVAHQTPLAGKRIRISVDGGRVRTRKQRRGRKTRRGRHKFDTPWREPRVLVIDVVNEQGKSDPLRLPLYDVLIDNADAAFAMIIGYLRLLGAARASEVVFIADGADRIWERVERLMTQAEIPAEKLRLVLDFYHASEHLAEAVQLCRNMKPKERKALYESQRHTLRHEPDGVEQVIEALKQRSITRRGKKMKKALRYFEKHIAHMKYAALDEMKLPVGSGQVESAVRRIINLRFKAPGSFWLESRVARLMHLRAFFKAGRWNELMKNVLNGTYEMPNLDAPARVPRRRLRLVKNSETSYSTELKEAA